MARPKKDEVVEEAVVAEEETEEVPAEEPVAEEASVEVEEEVVVEEVEVVEPIAPAATVDTLPTEAGVTLEEDGQPVLVRPDVSRLYASRAVFDTSGTAGKADHDLFRTAAVWDKEIKQMEEVPEHLQKQLDSTQNLDSIMGDAYRP